MKTSSFLWALALSIGILSCSDPHTSEGVSTAPEKKARSLTVLTWGEYVSPTAVEEFTKRTGIAVEIVEFQTSDEMIAMMHSQPGEFDIVTADDTTLEQMRDLSLLAKIDRKKVKNFENLDPRFLGLQCDPENTHSVPYLMGSTLIAYRKDKVADFDKSWKTLFDPKWDGRVALLDEDSDVLAVGLLAEGHSSISSEIDDIKEARDRIVRTFQGMETCYGNFIDVLDALDRGEIWFAMTYSGDVALYAAENPSIDFFVPEEGGILWLDHLVVSRDTKDLDAAHRFLDFMLEGKIAAETANAFNLMSPNLAAAPYMDEKIISDPRIYMPEDVLSKCKHLYSVDGELGDLMSKTFAEISTTMRISGRKLAGEAEEPREDLTDSSP